MARNMSQKEIDHRKKIQGNISRTTSTLGLGGLVAFTAGAAVKKNPGLLRKLPKYASKSDEAIRATGTKLGDGARNVGVVSGGIGGLGGYNFASYTNAESRQRKTAVKKSHEPDEYYDTPVFGDIYESDNPTD